MYRIILSIIGIGLILCGYSSNIPSSYELNGEVYNSRFNGKTIYLSKVDGDELTNIDSTLVEVNKFCLKGVQDVPTVCYLRFREDHLLPEYVPVTFILENGTINVQITKSDSKATGTVLNDSLFSFQKSMDKYEKQLTRIEARYKKMIADSTINKETEKQIYEEYNSEEKANLEFIKKVIGQNLNNILGAYIFNLNRNRLADKDIEIILQKAGSTFKNQPDIRLISERIRRLNNISVGKMFKDFDSQDIQGRKKSLSEYAGRGKFLIVGFWASISPSSRIEMKNLIEIHKKYKYKGIDIISVSLDTDSLSWIENIERYNLTCPHLSDFKGWESDAVKAYEINKIPYILLLNPDGSIAAKETDTNCLKEKLKELFD